MRLQFAAAPILFALSCQYLPGVDVSWTKQPGLALHISGNAFGSLWMIGTEEVVSGNYAIHRYLGNPGSEWRKEPGSGRRLAVDPKGDVWMVNAQNAIFRYRTETGVWEGMPGLATDIAAGADGSIWVIGIVSVAGGYPIYKWNGSNWTQISGGAVRIAVEKDGSPWVVNDVGNVYRYNLQANSWERKQTGTGRSVHTGAASGAVWVVGREPIAGGYPIQQWNAATNTWEAFGSYGAVAVTEVKGTPWIVQADGGIFSQGGTAFIVLDQITINPTLQSPVMPPLTPLPNLPVITPPAVPGKLLCSVADAGDLTGCDYTKADYVGAYRLDTTCDNGFYDLIYGGTCWECPKDTDEGGDWIRSADSVEKDTACWRAPKEKLTSAIKTKSPGWPWECPSGSFWDGYSPDGIGGSCWKCPDTHPRRTGNHISSSSACATPVNQTSPAKLLSFNGCPKPDKETMGLAGKRSPGKPFLDILAGWSQSVASGGCYACPAVDEQGNFLITARNDFPIYNKETNAGCRINFKYQPAPFTEPGLSGLRGVREVIWENRVFEGDTLTRSLYDQAEQRDMLRTSPEALAWVAARWKEISARPYNNEQFRLHMVGLLKAALAKTTTIRTPGEQMLIKSFEEYILKRRTYLAEQALAMYDEWKKYSGNALASRAQSQLETAFYYGTVPLDFNATLGGTMALGGTGSGIVGSMLAAQKFASKVVIEEGATAANRATSLWGNFSKPLNLLLKSPQALVAVSGASVIAVVGAVLSSIAIEQFIEIQTARTKLEASLALAKKPVSLDDLYKETNGEDLLYYYWGKALDTTDGEDQQVVAAAAAAHAYAQGKGYKP